MCGATVETANLARVVHDRIARDGGFTIDMWSGRPVTEGLAVCADPTRSLRVDLTTWESSAVERWLDACRVAAVQAGTNDGVELHIGGWHPAGRHVADLDLVRVLPVERRPWAHALGLLHRQRAIFDLASRRVLPVGAFG